MYKVKFNLDEFLGGRMVIRCLDEYEANSVLAELASYGFTWADGQYVGIRNEWSKYEYDTCYRCIRCDGRILGVAKQFDISRMGCETLLADRISFNEEIPNYKVFQLEHFIDKRVFIHCDTVEESQSLIDIICNLLPNVQVISKAIENTCYTLRTYSSRPVLSADPHQGMEHGEFGDELVVEFKELSIPMMAWKSRFE